MLYGEAYVCSLLTFTENFPLSYQC